jgi:hypothetical protein
VNDKSKRWLDTQPGSFVHEYMEGFKNVETARAYDFWCGCWLLSNAVGRVLTVPRPHAPVYLNLYTIICAEAGITRKSTAVRHATNILRSFRDNHNSEMELVTGAITPESLDDVMARLTANYHTSHVALSSSELVSLLGRERYTSALPGRLTDLYDCPALHTRTLRTGPLNAENVYITLLAASTPSWLVRAVNPDVIEGGFTSRCLFIVEERPKRLVAWPDDSDDSAKFAQRIAHRLSSISMEASYVATRAGGIRPTTAALQAFTEWYENRTLSHDPYTASFQAREDHHILRLAALMSVSDGRWEIHDHHIANAIAAIATVRRAGSSLFGTGLASSRTYALVDRIRQALVAAGRNGLSQSAVSATCRKYGSLDDIRQVLTIMHEMDLVQQFVIEFPGRGRPATMWRATRALLSQKVLEDVVDIIVPQTEA